MKRWFLLCADGRVEEKPAGWKPSLADLQAAVGGYVEHVQMDGRTELWLNEEGKLTGLPVNRRATAIWEVFYGHTDVVVGDVLLSVAGQPTKRNAPVTAILQAA